MLAKPEMCRPCPLWGDGQGFVPDRLVEGAPVLVLAQGPGEDEERGMHVTGYVGHDPLYAPCEPQPLIGRTGWWWERHLLPRTGLTREQVSLANVLRCRWGRQDAKGRWKKVNELPPAAILEKASEHCMATYFRIPTGTRLVVACGALAHLVTRGVADSVTEAAGSLAGGDVAKGDPPGRG